MTADPGRRAAGLLPGALVYGIDPRQLRELLPVSTRGRGSDTD